MQQQTDKERELAEILVEALDLEDITAAEIVPETSLFGVATPDSLGLDSIDALEISLSIAQNYGVQLQANNEINEVIFASLRALSDHIQSQL